MNIAIVGAGPAGISLAYFLNQHFPSSNITIYEATNAVAGQSISLRYKKHINPLGTCFSHTGYRSIHKLMKKFNVTRLLGPKEAYMLNADGRGIREIEITLPALRELAKIVIKLSSYRLAWRLFKQDANPTWSDNQLLFSEFLKKKNINLNSDLLKIATTGQLYGPPENITTHNALMWYTPALFYASMRILCYTIEEGFDELFIRMLKASNANVIYNSRISECMSSSGKVTLEPFNQTYDACFITTTLDAIKSPLSNTIESSGPFFDQHVISMHIELAKPQEKFFFSFEKCQYVSSISPLPLGRKIKSSNASWLVAKLPNKLKGISKQEIEALIFEDLKNIPSIEDYKILETKLFRYDIHFSPEQIAQELPQTIDRLQGQENIWYSGGSLSHWNVESIVNFNKKLAERFKREYPKALSN